MDNFYSELHTMSVEQMRKHCGQSFLPFLLMLIPCLLFSVLTFGFGLLLVGFNWILIERHVIERINGNAPRFAAYYSKDKFGLFFCVSLFRRAATLVLTLLLVIPGIYAYTSFSMASFMAIEDGGKRKALDYLSDSHDLIKGHRLQLLYLHWYCALAYLVTAATLGILAIWTIPYTRAMRYNFYIKLVSRAIPPLRLKKNKELSESMGESNVKDIDIVS